jgi:hypothetical protein
VLDTLQRSLSHPAEKLPAVNHFHQPFDSLQIWHSPCIAPIRPFKDSLHFRERKVFKNLCYAE